MPRAKKQSEKKIFVLDTSVILFEHNAIMNFEEHDIGLPITVLEELDQFKKGNDTKNFEAREFTRLLDKLAKDKSLQDWIPLNGKTRGSFKVVMEAGAGNEKDANQVFGEKKNDHRILNAALRMKDENPQRKVVLVSKDINLRLKAKSMGLPAEDYETGKIKNVQSLRKGKIEIEKVDSEIINHLYEDGTVEPSEVLKRKKPQPNQYFILKSDKNSVLAYFNSIENAMEKVDKRPVSGVKPRNAEQTFAIHSIMNPEVKLVTIQGVAGTGKTLLTLAGALEQRRNFKQIYLARPIVPLSNKDIGYLPGDIKSKLNPYMEPLWDNLKFIQNQYKETDKEFKAITEMVNK